MWWVFRRSFHNRLHLVFSVTSMTRARQENVMNIVKNGKCITHDSVRRYPNSTLSWQSGVAALCSALRFSAARV